MGYRYACEFSKTMDYQGGEHGIGIIYKKSFGKVRSMVKYITPEVG